MIKNILSLALLVVLACSVAACREEESLARTDRSLALVCQKIGQDDWNMSRADGCRNWT